MNDFVSVTWFLSFRLSVFSDDTSLGIPPDPSTPYICPSVRFYDPEQVRRLAGTFTLGALWVATTPTTWVVWRTVCSVSSSSPSSVSVALDTSRRVCRRRTSATCASWGTRSRRGPFTGEGTTTRRPCSPSQSHRRHEPSVEVRVDDGDLLRSRSRSLQVKQFSGSSTKCLKCQWAVGVVCESKVTVSGTERAITLTSNPNGSREGSLRPLDSVSHGVTTTVERLVPSSCHLPSPKLCRSSSGPKLRIGMRNGRDTDPRPVLFLETWSQKSRSFTPTTPINPFNYSSGMNLRTVPTTECGH